MSVWSSTAPAIILLSSCQSAGPTGGVPVAVVDDAAPLVESSATLQVRGMSCPLCATNIDKQLKRVEGVESVGIDLGTGAVVVRLAGEKRPTARQLTAAVEQAGFTVTSVGTP